jgi:tetratricopeptide (TPR) repeat protein
MREYDKSIAAAERAVELGPNFGEAYWSLGTALYHVSRPEEAIPYFQKAMRISPVPDFICLQGLGGSYRMLRRYDDAEATFKRLLQRFPDHIVGLMGLVNVYVETGRMEEAKTEAVEVLRINPQFSMDRYSRMLPFKEQSEVDRLVDALRKAGLK